MKRISLILSVFMLCLCITGCAEMRNPVRALMGSSQKTTEDADETKETIPKITEKLDMSEETIENTEVKEPEEISTEIETAEPVIESRSWLGFDEETQEYLNSFFDIFNDLYMNADGLDNHYSLTAASNIFKTNNEQKSVYYRLFIDFAKGYCQRFKADSIKTITDRDGSSPDEGIKADEINDIVSKYLGVDFLSGQDLLTFAKDFWNYSTFDEYVLWEKDLSGIGGNLSNYSYPHVINIKELTADVYIVDGEMRYTDYFMKYFEIPDNERVVSTFTATITINSDDTIRVIEYKEHVIEYANDDFVDANEALKIAQRFLDDHPLYKRTITGEVEYEPAGYGYDTNGLYRIGLITDDGSDRSMWVDKKTGEVFISPGGSVLLTGEKYYETVYNSEVLYRGVQIQQFFDYSYIYNTLGVPIEEDYCYIGYEDIAFYEDDFTGKVYYILGDPGAFNVNGVTLEKNRTGIVEILGVPIHEEWKADDEGYDWYIMAYERESYYIQFAMYSPDDPASLIYIEPF